MSDEYLFEDDVEDYDFITDYIEYLLELLKTAVHVMVYSDIVVLATALQMWINLLLQDEQKMRHDNENLAHKLLGITI